MDRRQHKTREAIFGAFTRLLSRQRLEKITVGQIIAEADVGRATFYAHFETRDALLEALCEELFCHIFDAAEPEGEDHRHIFHCDAPDCVFLHLFRHLKDNDNGLLALLRCSSNEVFLAYFRKGLSRLAERQLEAFPLDRRLPRDFRIHHIITAVTGTLRWWLAGGLRESPEEITAYLYLSLGAEPL